MTIRTVYVKAPNKKSINDRLAKGETVTCIEYHFQGDNCLTLTALNDGDVIKVWEKMINGSPYAKAYGNWNAKTGRVK